MRLHLHRQGVSPETTSTASATVAGAVDAICMCHRENHNIRDLLSLPPAQGAQQNYRGLTALLLRNARLPLIFASAEIAVSRHIYPDPLNTLEFAGLAHGTLTPLVTNPAEILTQEVMAAPSASYFQVMAEIWKKQSFYRGLGLNAARTGLGSCIILGILSKLGGF